MTAPALIFDCDGVLVDTEQTGHLQAFNAMWHELDVPWQWTTAQYARKLGICGGQERLASLYHDAEFRAAVPVPDEWTAWTDTVAAWHRHKTRHYLALLETGQIQVRTGVRRLAEQAAAAGWRLAVASSGAEESVNAIVRLAMGPDLASTFTVVTGQAVVRKKPDPEVYLHTARRLGVHPDRCVAVEDTRNGMLAAVGAGMRCLVTPTGSSRDHDFTGAALVVTDLGDPGAGPVATLDGNALTRQRGPVTLEDLRLLLTGSTPPGTSATAPTPGRQAPAPTVPGPRFIAKPTWVPQAVLFDCDGTLVDSEPCWTAALEALFGSTGLPWSPARKPDFIGRTAKDMAAVIATELGDPGRADVLEKELLDHVIQTLTTAQPMPGARDFLAAVAAAVPVAVVSNAPRAVLDIALARTGLGVFTDVTVAAEDTAHPKPAPDPYLLACRRLGVDPGRTLAIEDSPTGLAAARAAGTVTLGVPTLPDPAFGADWVVATLADPGLTAWSREWTGTSRTPASHRTPTHTPA